jgi:ubiquinone biosynthesis protein COQ4
MTSNSPRSSISPTPATASTDDRPVRRDPAEGARRYAQWLLNPVSAEGVVARHRARFALNGPEIARQVEQMRQDPIGRRVLADRPDLGAALSDMAALAAMPEGSLGREYHAFMDRPEVIPSALLASLLHTDGHFERLAWSEEMKFVVERRTQTHDLTHVLSGYGTSFPAEAINIAFSYAIEGTSGTHAMAEVLAGLSFAVMAPSVGPRRWRQLVIAAAERGEAAARRRPLQSAYIEELLPLPLDEARAELAIPPLEVPVEAPESWIRNPIGKKMAHGYGNVDPDDRDLEVALTLFRSGARSADIGRADRALRDELVRRLDAGATPGELVTVLADGAAALRTEDHMAVGAPR